MKLNLGCGTHYAKRWTNVDVMECENTHPDIVADLTRLPFDDDSAERVYCGHVMEHIPWAQVPFVLAEVHRVLAPDGLALFTGPDVYRTIEMWHRGKVSWALVQSVLEHQDEASPHWPGAVHHWNCHLERLLGAARDAGFKAEEPHASASNWMVGWPVVNWSAWQCAVLASKP